MTQPDTSNSVYTDAARLLEWLQNDIADRGGSGRRVSKVAMNLDFGDEPERFWLAVTNLVDRGLLEVDRATGAAYGWIYLVPR